ncbi:MAG TPA: ferritin-like domain-containing protein [Polyangiaceae bacterium]
MNRETSIQLLNKSVADELSAVHQYLYFHFHLEDQGLGPLALLFRTTAVQEMGHIALLSERILFLKGDVTLKAADDVERITDPVAILEKAMKMEEASVVDYNNFALECAKAADSKTKQLFEALVADEERHYGAWEKQLDNIRRFGLSYLALQSFSAGEPPVQSGPAGTAG